MPEERSGNNRRAVADYQCSAREYVATVNGRPSASAEALRRLAARVAPGACVLEIGSGPGWDADALEALGVDVHRTDVTAAFCDFQAERGKRCDRLDLLSDRIDVRYGGAMMLCVLQHFERSQLKGALRKLAGALDAGGPLLLMYPEGDDEYQEHGAAGDYLVVRWTPAAFDAHLARAGFEVAWQHTIDGRGGSWRTVLAQRRSRDGGTKAEMGPLSRE
jgi:protein-L-isoaspartate O-methyltransferase